MLHVCCVQPAELAAFLCHVYPVIHWLRSAMNNNIIIMLLSTGHCVQVT